jgi:hypothetical protein
MLAGGLIYLLWRPETIRLFAWIGPAKDWSIYTTIRDLGSVARPHHFIVYSLPDGLWLASFGHALLVVVRDASAASRAAWLAVPVTLGIGSEFLQMMGIVGGVFDRNDILAYSIAGAYLQLVNIVLD